MHFHFPEEDVEENICHRDFEHKIVNHLLSLQYRLYLKELPGSMRKESPVCQPRSKYILLYTYYSLPMSTLRMFEHRRPKLLRAVLFLLDLSGGAET